MAHLNLAQSHLMFEWFSNPLVAGITGAGIATMLLNRASTLPGLMYRGVKERFTLTLTVFSEQVAFEDLDQWIAHHPGSKKFRSFGIASKWDEELQARRHSLGVGVGLHILRHNGRWVLINREIDKGTDTESSPQRRQTITISTMGRNRKFMEELLNQIGESAIDETKTSVWILGAHGEFRLIERKPNRSMDSVFCAPGIKETLVSDYTTFMGRREWYQTHGIPWRRGYMLEGPPGTGKTSLIFALAGLARKPVYVINLATVGSDSALVLAMNEARDGFVVLEDVDDVGAVVEREATVEEARKRTKPSGVTLSGLLNAIDGLSARDGRVLFVTSNRPHILDAALLRAGRVDLRIELAKADLGQAVAMFRSLTDGSDEEKFVAWVSPRLPISHADLQGVFLSGKWKEPDTKEFAS